MSVTTNLDLNLAFGWTWILAGLVSGALLGLRFHLEGWLGGHASWRRRLLRLGHVALIGTGLLNVAFAATRDALALPDALASVASGCLLAGGLAMPLGCALAAWRKPLRHVLPLPASLLLTGCALASFGAIA